MNRIFYFIPVATVFLTAFPFPANSQGKLELTSSAFKNNEMIPSKYTCQGEDINPELEIKNIPDGTKSLVLIVDDPDAPMGTWVHWVVFNIPNTVEKIKENSMPGVGGINNFGKLNYGGPCPPSGTHRYFFKLYALDTLLAHKENASKNGRLPLQYSHRLLPRVYLKGCLHTSM